MSKGITFIFRDVVNDIDPNNGNTPLTLRLYNSTTLFNVKSIDVTILDEDEIIITVSNNEKIIKANLNFNKKDTGLSNPMFNISNSLLDMSINPDKYKTVCITRNLKDKTKDEYVIEFKVIEKYMEYESVYDTSNYINALYIELFTPYNTND